VGGPVDVRATIPRGLVGVRPPAGGSFDPATRTVRFRLRSANRVRYVRARVARTARRGTLLETIGYVSGPGDPLLLDDRGVDHSTVARRGRATAVASITGPRPVGFCRLR
jgi:hypothetical protein